MNCEKVYLRIDTPFTMKNRKTRQLVLRMASMPVMMLLLLAWLYSNGEVNRELAERMTLLCALWAVFGALPTVLMGIATSHGECAMLLAMTFFFVKVFCNFIEIFLDNWGKNVYNILA